MSKGCPRGLKPKLTKLFAFRLGWRVYALPDISAAAPLIIASPGVFQWYKRNLLQDRNYGRWIEDSFSASLMIVLMSMLAGVSDIAALIAIDEENVIKYAQDNKIQFGTYSSLTQAQEIKQLIQKEVDRVNKMLAQVEQVKKFTIIPKKLYEEDGEVTPTMKVKRRYINETYKDIIEKMYKSGME